MSKSSPQKIWTDEYRVASFEVDQEGKAPLTALCHLMQETAHNHAENLGVGYSHLGAKNLVWVLRAQKVRMERFPRWKDIVKVRTWPSGKDKLFYYRDFKFLDDKDSLLGYAASKWMVVETDSRRPQRADAHFEFDLWHSERVFGDDFGKPAKISAPEFKAEIAVRWSDIDLYRHVNNAVYIQYIMDLHRRRSEIPLDLREINIEYASEAVFGDKILLEIQTISNDKCLYQLVRMEDLKIISMAETVWGMAEEKI